MNRNIRVRVDGYTRFCLTAIAVLLTVLVVGLWANFTPAPPAARAGEVFVDPVTQRIEMLSAAKETNNKLDDLLKLLKSGDAKFQVQAPAKGDEGDNASKKPR
jgi:hypothetical protein